MSRNPESVESHSTYLREAAGEIGPLLAWVLLKVRAPRRGSLHEEHHYFGGFRKHDKPECV